MARFGEPQEQHDPDHYKRLRGSVDTWNRWRSKNPETAPNLAGVDMAGAILKGFDLSGANLRKANLSECELSGTDLRNSDLQYGNFQNAVLRDASLYQAECFRSDFRGADFSRADLKGAKFHDADLRGVTLRGADLYRVDFVESRLSGANLANARCWLTAFSNVDLSEVGGLSDVIHDGPCHVDFLTLIRSSKNLDHVFLRGVGLPDTIIQYLPSLLRSGQPVQFYSCFISYSMKAHAFAKRLHSRMVQEGLRVWYAPEDIKGGHKIHEQIDEAIRVYDKMLLVLSEYSMKSEWVATEIRKARKAERQENQRKLFPIRLIPFEAIHDWECFDADSGKDMGVEVREYFIPDFTNWKDHAAFEESFAKLLRDLKADDSSAT